MGKKPAFPGKAPLVPDEADNSGLNHREKEIHSRRILVRLNGLHAPVSEGIQS